MSALLKELGQRITDKLLDTTGAATIAWVRFQPGKALTEVLDRIQPWRLDGTHDQDAYHFYEIWHNQQERTIQVRHFSKDPKATEHPVQRSHWQEVTYIYGPDRNPIEGLVYGRFVDQVSNRSSRLTPEETQAVLRNSGALYSQKRA